MKSTKKELFLHLLIFFFLLIIITCLCMTVYFDYVERQTSSKEFFLEYCTNNSYEINPLICEHNEYKANHFPDTFQLFYSIVNSQFFWILESIFPTLIIFMGIYKINSVFKSQFLKNLLTRENYKKIYKSIIIDSYKNIWIIPLIMFYTFILCCFMTNSNFDYSYAINTSAAVYNLNVIKYPGLFILTYIINLLFISVFYINIGLLVCKKNSNSIISTTIASIIYYIISFINTFVIIPTINKLLNTSVEGYISFFDMYTYTDRTNLLGISLTSFSLAFISLLIVVIFYKNKEKTIIDFERMEE